MLLTTHQVNSQSANLFQPHLAADGKRVTVSTPEAAVPRFILRQTDLSASFSSVPFGSHRWHFAQPFIHCWCSLQKTQALRIGGSGQAFLIVENEIHPCHGWATCDRQWSCMESVLFRVMMTLTWVTRAEAAPGTLYSLPHFLLKTAERVGVTVSPTAGGTLKLREVTQLSGDAADSPLLPPPPRAAAPQFSPRSPPWGLTLPKPIYTEVLP